MKIIEGTDAREFTPDVVDGHYLFPCGCKFRVLEGEARVNAHIPMALDRDMPLDCPLVYEMLSNGATAGVFQLESRLGKTYAMKLKPENIEHLSALVALLRPGCLQVKNEDGDSMTDLYCLRKNGLREVVYSTEALRPFLESSYGVMLYQEILLLIAKVLAGFDLIKLDRLRKGVGKKDLELLNKLGKEFVDDATALGKITHDEAVKIFDDMKKSGRYLFNKAHSITYAYGTYESAYFKAHFPEYFFTSYLEGAKHKMKPLVEVRHLIRDARRFGIEVLTPRFVDLNPIFSSDGVKVRFGLANIKGIGEKAVAKMAESLESRPYLEWSWYDFLTLGTGACGSTAVRNMIQAGAMTDWDFPRQRMLAEFEAWDGLTEKEQEGVVSLREALYKAEAIYESRQVEEEVHEYDKVELAAYHDALEVYRLAGTPIHDWDQFECVEDVPFESTDPKVIGHHPAWEGEPPTHPAPIKTKIKKKKSKVKVGENQVLIDEARPVSNIEDALAALLARPGAITKNRRLKVESILSLLQDPPYPLVDTPYLIAKNEEELLGVPVTTQAMAHVDRSILNTTVKQFLDGKDDPALLIIGVEVLEVSERVVRNGDNRGAKMASLIVGDGDHSMDDVVVFPEAWDRYGLTLMRPGAVVALGGKRNFKNPQGFIVEKVWSL